MPRFLSASFLRENKQFLGLLLFTVCFTMAVMAYCFLWFHIDVEITLQSDSKTSFQVYWKSANQGYIEQWSIMEDIDEETSKIKISIPDYKFVRIINPITKLRIDPHREPAQIVIKQVIVKQLGYHPVVLSTSRDFDQLVPLNDIIKTQFGPEGFKIISSGEDPQFELALKSEISQRFLAWGLLASIGVGLILGGLFNLFNVNGQFIFIPYLMTIILALILTGSIISKKLHFDEYVHVKAVLFYENHWLPPEICDPDTEATYSVYGSSRLNSYEIVYLLAGKFSRLLHFTPLHEYIRARLFNVVLFSILLLLSVYKWEYRILVAPFIISPQIWYTFTYFNSEAFALFFLILISYQVLCQDSYLNRYLMEPQNKWEFLHWIVLGLVFAILFLIKNTFYIIMIFLLLYFFIRLLNKEFSNPRIALKRAFLIIVIAVSGFGLRYALDVSINGFDRTAQLMACKEKLAKPMYKPSTELNKQHPYINLKKRGVSLREVFSNRNWDVLSFASMFGKYNYATAASKHYYKIVFLLIVGFGCFVCISFLFNGSSKHLLLLFNFFLCGAVVLGLSVWTCWVHDFQAQGRYLFPILIMFAFLLFESVSFLSKRFLNFFTISLFLFSLYSYLLNGLIQMPKF